MGTKNVELVLSISATRSTARLAMLILAHRSSDREDSNNYRTTWAGEGKLASDAGMSISGWRKARKIAERSGEIITYDRRSHRLTNITFFVLGLTEAEMIDLMSSESRFRARGTTGDDDNPSTAITPKGKEFIDVAVNHAHAASLAKIAIAQQVSNKKLVNDRDRRLSLRGKIATGSR